LFPPAAPSQPFIGQEERAGLENKPWVNLVEENVNLFEECDRLLTSLDASSREFAQHVNCRLGELLHRAGVTIIAGDATFDRVRHQSDPADSIPTNGMPVAETQSPGFAVGRRVFRRARVKVNQPAPTAKGPPS
jgi:molecular chaperone GrpE (heat shock protein)